MSANIQPTPNSTCTNDLVFNLRRRFAPSLAMFLFLLTVLLLGITGCSDNGKASNVPQQGKLEFSIKWPQDISAAKFIPARTQSLVLSITNTARTLNQTQTINREFSDLQQLESFDNIPVGEVTVTVTAYPERDGIGTALATAMTVVTIAAANTTRCTLDLNSTIDHLVLNSVPAQITTGQTLQLFVSAKDENGGEVLLPVNGTYWRSSDTSIATVDENGNVNAVGNGEVTITAIDRETGKTAILSLNVVTTSGGLVVALEDSDISVILNTTNRVLTPLHNTFDFTASVTGSPNQLVEWSVQETDGGSITQTGHYTAPTIPGIYHVITTSIANATKTAIATVTVANVNVNPGIANIVLTPGDRHDFTASINGIDDQSVKWSVEGQSSDDIDSDTGVYIAPSTLGTYHVIATSVACPTETASITVLVVDISMALDTDTIALKPGAKHTFSVTISGINDKRTSWLVQENGGGTITQDGAYTAPTTPGIYHVIAMSTVCPTERVIATITVAI